MARGSLFALLAAAAEAPGAGVTDATRLDVARGLAYMHGLSPPVLHRDVKPAQVLVDAGGRAKLADFGVAVTTEEVAAEPPGSPFMGTPEFAAPEQMLGGAASEKT